MSTAAAESVQGTGRPSFSYTIGGVKIELPVKPYPSQVSMMDKVIRGCQKQQNCLLESPTGSGKTLALLCSALAWQRAEKVRLEKLSEEEFNQKITEWQQKEQQKKQQMEKKNKKQKMPEKKLEETDDLKPAKSKGWSSSAVTVISDDDDSEAEMAVFKQPGKKRKINNNQRPDLECDTTLKNLNDSIMTNDSSLMTEDEDDNEVETADKMPKKAKLVVPIIFFCTRTHKQIDQVVKELQRTSYNNAKSCILASREHTCIADQNIYYPHIQYKSKTELCRDLLDPRARRRNALKLKRPTERCSYYDNGGVKIGSYTQLDRYDVPSVWDIEDIVSLGIKKHSCPYYGTRLLLKTADIVFCPYNYIIDPVIRSTMNMKLRGHVIIVDEAHNIEDQCRDAASLKVDQTNLNLAKMDCEKISKFGVNSVAYAALARYMSDLSKWIDEKSNEIKSFDDYNRGVTSWSGTYTIASFNEFGVGLKAFEQFKEYCNVALEDMSEEKPVETKETDETKPEENNITENELEEINMTIGGDASIDSAITNATKNMLTSICTVFSLFFDETYQNDYHVSLEKLMHLKQFEHGEQAAAPVTIDGWIDGAQPYKDATRPVWNNTLSFLCLNPAAVFHELKSTARCIVLTSGTLSPMASFQSELGTQFPIALEANHVIKPGQCWVTSVARGPADIDLNGQYHNTNTYGFQDEMGRVLLDVCQTVPYGVLCFMPSYMLMDKLYARWQETGLLRDLGRVKAVMCEPRRGDQLEKLMGKYYEAVARAVRLDSDEGRRERRGGYVDSRSGALFLAVYRGKISEGLDFSDNNARAVVAVGIPFPNFKEVTVTHKKAYNDKHHQSKGLLGGWDWYQIQAYRALNQALGRCIRHRNDWGAIFLVDSRYLQAKNLSGLSKWLRGRVEHNNSWAATMVRLKSFIETRQQED